MSKTFIKKEKGREFAYEQESFFGETYEVSIGELTESAGFFDRNKRTTNLFGTKVIVEKEIYEHNGERKGSVDNQEGTFSRDENAPYGTENYLTFKPNQRDIASSKSGNKSEPTQKTSIFDYTSIGGKLVSGISSFVYVGAVVGGLTIFSIIGLECCVDWAKNNLKVKNDSFESVGSETYSPRYNYYQHSNVAHFFLTDQMIAENKTFDVVELHYPNISKIYKISRKKYPSFYNKLDIIKDKKITAEELKYFQARIIEVSIRHKAGDLEGIVNDFINSN